MNGMGGMMMNTGKRLIAVLLAVCILLPFGSALAVRYYRVDTSWLKAHEDADYSSRVVDSYRRDFAVTIAKRYSGGWAKVRFRPGGKAVFVQEKYLAACDSYTAYVSKDDTVLLSGPATSFDSLGKLHRGAKVTVLTHGAAFDYVSSSKGKGYIRNTRLTTAKPDGKTAFIKNPANRTVNLRKGPGKGYKVIAEYRPGTKVTILKYGKTWCKVSVRGKVGYIMTKYIRTE